MVRVEILNAETLSGAGDGATGGGLRGSRLNNADDLLEVCAGMRGAILHGHVHRCFRVDIPGVEPTLFGAGSTTEAGNEGFWLFDIEARGATATKGGYERGRYALVG